MGGKFRGMEAASAAQTAGKALFVEHPEHRRSHVLVELREILATKEKGTCSLFRVVRIALKISEPGAVVTEWSHRAEPIASSA